MDLIDLIDLILLVLIIFYETGLNTKIYTLFKRKVICKHENIGEGWFIQQVRFRKCEDCGETEVEGSGIHSFVKLTNSTYTNHRYRGE